MTRMPTAVPRRPMLSAIYKQLEDPAPKLYHTQPFVSKKLLKIPTPEQPLSPFKGWNMPVEEEGYRRSRKHDFL